MTPIEMEDAFSKKKVFEDLKHDLQQAKEAKAPIDKLITQWGEDYDGHMSALPNRSQYKSMEIAKQIEKIKTNISEPFTNTSHPIRTTTSKYEGRARTMQKYLNQEFTTEFDRVHFISQLSDVLCREGTVWIKSAWNFEEKNIREVLPNVKMEDILARGEDPDVIKPMENDRFSVEYNNVKMIKNNPDAIICRNEHIFPDPNARSKEDMRFMCYRKHVTLSELKASGRISQTVLNKIDPTFSKEQDDTAHGTDRDSKAQDYGYKEGFETRDKTRQKIPVIEYYGYYDINNDGVVEPIYAMWTERDEINLILEENGMPQNPIPFYSEVFSEVTFSLWGRALAYFIADNQRAKTGIMRGIFDNMALANNGVKFIRRGTMDYVNMKRFRNGEKHIIVNKDPKDNITDGSFNSMPNDIFHTYENLSRESEEFAGNKGNGMALSPNKVSEDKAGELTMAQQIQLGLVIKIGGLLSHVFKDWLSMADSFLENEQIEALYSESEKQDLFTFEDNSFVQIKFKVATNAQRQMRLQQLNLLLQQSKVLGEQIPGDLFRELIAEMYELFDMYEKAEALRQYQPQPDPMQQMMAQIEIQKAQLELQKLQAEINEINSRAGLNGANAQKGMLDGMSNYGYKQAQSTEKLSKAKSHDVDNALSPAKAIAEIESMLNNINKGQ